MSGNKTEEPKKQRTSLEILVDLKKCKAERCRLSCELDAARQTVSELQEEFGAKYRLEGDLRDELDKALDNEVEW